MRLNPRPDKEMEKKSVTEEDEMGERLEGEACGGLGGGTGSEGGCPVALHRSWAPPR